MSRGLRAVAAVGCLIGWTACRSETGIIVELDAISAVRPQLREIVVQVWSGGPEPAIEETVTMRGDEPPDRPLAGLGLRPADPGKDGVIDIVAIGRPRAPAGPGAGSLTAEATVTFHRGDVQRVPLMLGALCDGRCPTNYVCSAAGRCGVQRRRPLCSRTRRRPIGSRHGRGPPRRAGGRRQPRAPRRLHRSGS
jgi:hypothetical protein